MKPTITGTKSADSKQVPSPYTPYRIRRELERAYLATKKKDSR